MDTLQFLAHVGSLVGQGGNQIVFSAMTISRHFEISPYHSRKLVASLRNSGVVRRAGNQYVLTSAGLIVARELAIAREGMFVK